MKTRLKTFRSSSGLTILVGRDDQSNDELTFDLAHPNDLWFHVHGAPGSHVILQCGADGIEPDKTDIEEAAALAAWFSKLRQGGQVPVHYCYAKHISKPKQAPAGTVSIRQEKRVKVRPSLLVGE